MMDLVGLPLTSTILFILAGILIGHALWCHDRSGDKARVDQPERRYIQARSVARQRRRILGEVVQARDRQLSELGSLRQQHTANLVQLKSLQRSSGSSEADSDLLPLAIATPLSERSIRLALVRLAGL